MKKQLSYFMVQLTRRQKTHFWRHPKSGPVPLAAVLAVVLLILAATGALAATRTFNIINSPLTIDNNTFPVSLTFLQTDFASTDSIVEDVNLTIEFAKIDNDGVSCSSPPISGGGSTFNNEIYFRLTSPSGTSINLVNTDTYSGGDFGGLAIVTFDDAASNTPSGTPTTGTYRPVDPLSTFNGEPPAGTWIVTIGDNADVDPLCLYSVTLEVIEFDPNQPPVNTVPGAQTTAEDTPLIFSTANGNPISISDPDAGSNQVEVTLAVTNGTLTLSGVADLNFGCTGCTGDGTNDTLMSFRGAIADINSALDGATYQPTANYDDLATLTITTNDRGYSGEDGIQTDTDTVSITVTGVNNPPVNTVPTTPQTTNEDTALFFSSANGNQISISDVDAGSNQVEVILSVANGTSTLSGVADLTFSTGDGTDDADMTFRGTITAINTALNDLHFDPSANFSGPASLLISTDDLGHTGAGGAGTDSDSVSITVNPVNDAPVLDNSGDLFLTAINEDDFTNNGTLLSDIIASGGGAPITNVDGPAEGVAVVQVDNNDGVWQYSLDGGGSWVDFGSPSTSQARLLALNGLTRIRFVPDPDYNGTVDPGLTFHAWDQSNGSIGGVANTLPNGGSTAFSAASETAAITIAVQADLQLTKTDLTDPVDLAESFLYELVAVNLGPSDAQNVVITDALDSRLIFQGASQGCAYSGGVVTCNVGTLAANSSDRYLISVAPSNVVSGTILSNSAGITSTTLEVNPADNLAGPITTTVQQKPGPQADLTLTKQTNQATIYAGGVISYTIVATNAGAADATSVWLQELVPFGTTVMHLTADNPAATGEFCSLNGLCYLGTLPVGRVATVTVELLLDDDYRQPDLTNQAHVSASQTDPNPNDNLTGVTTPVVAPGCAARINNLLPIYLTPQAAVDAARSGDTIKVAGYCAGVHSRGGFLQSVYINQPLTIRGGYTLTNWLDSDPATHPATIDAVGGGRVLYLTGAGVHVNVENLNLTGGSYLAGLGGGIFIAGTGSTSADISGTRIYRNTAGVGGGLYAAGTVSLTATEVVSNTAPGNAGGAYLAGPTNITNSRIAHNQSLGNGGGLYGAGSLNLTGSGIEANRAVRGGGLYVAGNLVMSGTEFNGNQANIGGGGAYVLGSTILAGGRFENNIAVTNEGGGLYSYGPLTVTGAQFISNQSNNGGGGLFVADATSATIQEAYFESNASQERGGGLAVGIGSSLVMTNTHFLSNTVASDHGGGVNLWGGAAAITACRFENNRCTDNDCNGGGLYVLELGNTLTVARSEFSHNQAGSNGGGLYTGNTLVMTTTQFLDNQARIRGGGVYAGNGVDMAHSLLLGNQADNDGGGLYLEAGNGRLINDILTRNSATNDGAGLYLNSPGRVDVIHTTLANPTLAAGQAIYANRGVVSVANTIVASYTTAIQRASGTVSEDYSLFFGNGADLSGTINSGDHSVTGFPPDFADPVADDYHLQPTSMAIDLGENAGVIHDYDFNPRPAPVSPYVDAGAYEYPGQAIDLRLTKTGAETLVAGEVLTYTLTIDNLGPSKARQLILTDTLPPGVALSRVITSTGGSCLAGPNPIICTLPLLRANDSISFTIVVTSDSTLEPGARLVNRAEARSAMNETNWTNNLATVVTTIIDRADLVLEKRGPATVTAGMPVTYTVVATNTGPSLARSVNLADYVPIGTGLQSVTVARSGVGTIFCGGAHCQLGNMVVGEVVTMTVVALVGPDASPGTLLTNSASIFSLMTVDPNPANNNASQTSLVETLADLALTKIALADPTAAGELLMYELNVTNNGPALARQVLITDTIPASTTFVGASNDCAESDGQVSCQLGDLAAGAETSAWVQVRIDPMVISGTLITNNAFVRAANSPGSSATATTRVAAVPAVDLSLSKTGPATASSGEQITFTIVVTNTGPIAVPFVYIQDSLPAGLTFERIDVVRSGIGLISCTDLSCQIDNMVVDEVVTATVTATVASGAVLTNTAVVSGSVVDNNPANNGDSHPVTIINSLNVYLPLVIKGGATNRPDLVGSFSLTPDKTSYSAGESVLITAVVVNQGNAVADGFWVDFYINPASAPGVNVRWNDTCSLSPCYGLAWYVEDLAPGESAVLTSNPGSYEGGYSNWVGHFASGTSDLYLYVDSWNPTVATGGVLESNESNNQAERHGLTVTGLEASEVDLSEPLELPPRPVRLDR